MKANYLLLPNEILGGEILKNPRAGRKRGNKIEPEFLEFSPVYKIILMGIVSLLTPNDNKIRKKEITYKDISDACGTPISTVEEKMPIIRHNFPYIFYVIERKFGKGYSYKLNPNFVKELISAYAYYSKLQNNPKHL